jgi:hypothetical protein
MNIKHTLIASAVLGALSAQAVALDFPSWPIFGQTSLTHEEVLHDSLTLQHGEVAKGLSGQHAEIVSGQEAVKTKMDGQYTDRSGEIDGIVSTFSERHDDTQSALESFHEAGKTTLDGMINVSANRYSALGNTLSNIVGSLERIEQYGASNNDALLAEGNGYKARVSNEESSFVLNTDRDADGELIAGNDITFETRIDNLENEVTNLNTSKNDLEGNVSTLEAAKDAAELKLSNLKTTKTSLDNASNAFNRAIKDRTHRVAQVGTALVPASADYAAAVDQVGTALVPASADYAPATANSVQVGTAEVPASADYAPAIAQVGTAEVPASADYVAAYDVTLTYSDYTVQTSMTDGVSNPDKYGITTDGIFAEDSRLNADDKIAIDTYISVNSALSNAQTAYDNAYNAAID